MQFSIDSNDANAPRPAGSLVRDGRYDEKLRSVGVLVAHFNADSVHGLGASTGYATGPNMYGRWVSNAAMCLGGGGSPVRFRTTTLRAYAADGISPGNFC